MKTEQLVSLDCTPPGLRVAFQVLPAQESQISLDYALPLRLT